MKTIAKVLIWNSFIFPIGLPWVTQTWRKPWKKLSPHSLNEWCNWQPKKSDDVICLRLWRGTYTQQCWIPMWILLWYSDSCFCDCLCVKSECSWDCQKKGHLECLGRMPRSIVIQQVVVQDLLTIWIELFLRWTVNFCPYLSVRVVSIKLQYMFICRNKSSLISWVLIVKFHHDLFIIFVFIVFIKCVKFKDY